MRGYMEIAISFITALGIIAAVMVYFAGQVINKKQEMSDADMTQLNLFLENFKDIEGLQFQMSAYVFKYEDDPSLKMVKIGYSKYLLQEKHTFSWASECHAAASEFAKKHKYARVSCDILN